MTKIHDSGSPHRRTESAPEPPGREGGWPAWLPRVAAESVLIVFSILLALAVNEWAEARQRRADAASAVQSIRQEVARNARLISARLPYHLALRDSLRVEMDRAGGARRLRSLPEMGFRRGFGTSPKTSDAVWRMVLATRALDYLPPDDLYALSEIYSTQEELENTSEMVIGRLDAYHAGVLGVAPVALGAVLLRNSWEDLVLREQELDLLYRKVLADSVPR